MKYLLILLLLLTLIGCDSEPKYKVDTCFKHDLTLSITEITKVDKEYYYFTVHVLFMSQEGRMTHKMFEEESDKKGLMPKPCLEFRKKDDITEEEEKK